MKIRFKHFAFLLAMTLMGCETSIDRTYLLQNPRFLGKELSRCRMDSSFDERYCAMVKQTASTFIAFEHLQSTDPEKFGLQILSAQEELGELAKKMETAKDEQQRQQAKTAYDKQRQKVDTLLAVVAAMGQIE